MLEDLLVASLAEETADLAAAIAEHRAPGARSPPAEIIAPPTGPSKLRPSRPPTPIERAKL